MRTRMTRTMLSLASVLALAGCGGGGLEVSGQVSVETSSATTGFNFPQPVRLDGGAGLITGSCVMRRSAEGSFGVVIDLFSSDANPEGRAIRMMSIMTRSDASSGSIEVQLGADDFESANCLMQVTALDAATGQIALQSTSDCTLTGPAGETATVAFELGLLRCGLN